MLDPDQILIDIAEYAGSFKITSELAYEGAHYCLMDSLACGFLALEDPACTKFLGPVVPGATLRGGARVPGTELDPINAAFNIGAMVRWLDCNDTGLAADGGSHPSDNLGGILGVADYLSRCGKSLRVRDMLEALIKAHEIQSVLGLQNSFSGGGLDLVWAVRLASTAVVTAMLGGTRQQIMNAVSNAWVDGGALCTDRHASNGRSRQSWAVADASSRGVRVALFALKADVGRPSASNFEKDPIVLARPFGSDAMESMSFKISQSRASATPVLIDKFATSVAAHFLPQQAESIKAMFAARKALAAMPVSDFVAQLVTAA